MHRIFSSLVEITKAFDEAQLYVDRVGVQVASDDVRRHKRALFDCFHEQNKRKETQSLLLSFLKLLIWHGCVIWSGLLK